MSLSTPAVAPRIAPTPPPAYVSTVINTPLPSPVLLAAPLVPRRLSAEQAISLPSPQLSPSPCPAAREVPAAMDRMGGGSGSARRVPCAHFSGAPAPSAPAALWPYHSVVPMSLASCRNPPPLPRRLPPHPPQPLPRAPEEAFSPLHSPLPHPGEAFHRVARSPGRLLQWRPLHCLLAHPPVVSPLVLWTKVASDCDEDGGGWRWVMEGWLVGLAAVGRGPAKTILCWGRRRPRPTTVQPHCNNGHKQKQFMWLFGYG